MKVGDIKYTKGGDKVVIEKTIEGAGVLVGVVYVTSDTGQEQIRRHEVVQPDELFDSPAKSWKTLQLEKEEKLYEKMYEDLHRKKELLKEDELRSYKALEARVKWLRNIAKEPIDEKLKSVIITVSDFLENKDKWVLLERYQAWELKSFDDFMSSDEFNNYYSDGRFKEMRLISLYGGSHGDLRWKISDYGDGSGGRGEILLFGSYDQARQHMQKVLDARWSYCHDDIRNAEEHNLKLDPEKLAQYDERNKKERLSRIANYRNKIEELEKSIKELEDDNS